jgi:hypothetical protein
MMGRDANFRAPRQLSPKASLSLSRIAAEVKFRAGWAV